MRHYRPMSQAARDARAEAKRAAGDPMRTDDDFRSAIVLDLRGGHGPNLVLEPRRGYIAWRARDADTGKVVAVASLKQLLHQIADELTPMQSPKTR